MNLSHLHQSVNNKSTTNLPCFTVETTDVNWINKNQCEHTNYSCILIARFSSQNHLKLNCLFDEATRIKNSNMQEREVKVQDMQDSDWLVHGAE